MRWAETSMQVLIADDFYTARSRLKEILADAYPGVRFSEAANGDEVMCHLASSPCDLLLLDINMPGRNGIDVLKDVKRVYPQLPVLIVSFHSREYYAARCLAAGAAAYINKDDALEELVPAARKILQEN